VKRSDTIKNFFYNVMASVLPTLILQLIILPLIADKMDGNHYGLALTIIAASSLIAGGLGNVLNNIRLLENNEYEKRNIIGDFGIYFMMGITLVSLTACGVSFYYDVGGIYVFLLNCLMSIAIFTKEYYIVRFWIDLDYFRILVCNVLGVLGNFIGLLILWNGGEWQYVYIVGNVVSILYIVKKYPITSQMFKRTVRFKESLKKTISLSVSTILSRGIQYVDRLLLYPLLGGEEVTIYYVSTLIGKTMSMALSPVNSFILSQLARKKSVKTKIFVKMLLTLCVLGIVGYFVCVILAEPVVGLIYPQWIELSMTYIRVTTITAMLSSIGLILKPMVLKFCNLNWTMAINAINFCVYVFLSLLLLQEHGLMGFCVGGMITNAISLILIIVIYLFAGTKGEQT